MEGPTLPAAIVIRGAGYHVYRAATSAGPFTRLNTDLISATNFTDAVQATNTYMVRAVKLEVSASGSYYNASQGIFQSFIPVVLPVLTISAQNTNKVFGALLPGFTALYSGFTNGDTPAGLSAQPVLSTPATSAREITYRNAIEYIDWRTSYKKRTGKTTGRNTAILELKTLAMIMGEAVRLGHAEANPLVSIKLRRDKAEKKPELTDKEIVEIRTALKQEPEWMQRAFEIALHTGCRLRETRIPRGCRNRAAI
jgi:hypothetical protein